MKSAGPSSVTASWARIDAWLARHAPVSAAVLAGPADPAEIAAAEADLGLEFPAEVVESLLIHNGQLTWANIVPDQPPLSVAGIVAHWQMCMDVAADVDGFTRHGQNPEPWWHPQWLPFGESDGDSMIVDLRPGPGYLRVGSAIHDNFGDFTDSWPTLGRYLDAVAEVLTVGGSVQVWHPYLTTKGELWWDLADQTMLNDEPLRPAPTM